MCISWFLTETSVMSQQLFAQDEDYDIDMSNIQELQLAADGSESVGSITLLAVASLLGLNPLPLPGRLFIRVNEASILRGPGNCSSSPPDGLTIS
jgi:hypothetical protein